MPDQGRPRIVQHPLNHSGRNVFVAAVALEHGAFAVVSNRLRLAFVIFQRSSGSVAFVQSISEHIHSSETLAAGVIIPYVIHWPEMFLGNKSLHAFQRGNRRPRTGFRVVSICASTL